MTTDFLSLGWHISGHVLRVQDPHEIRVDEESKLTLHGLLQYYVKLTEKADVFCPQKVMG